MFLKLRIPKTIKYKVHTKRIIRVLKCTLIENTSGRKLFSISTSEPFYESTFEFGLIKGIYLVLGLVVKWGKTTCTCCNCTKTQTALAQNFTV